MVFRKNMKTKYALISVYDKSDLNYLCKNLKKHSYKFIATGSTFKKIKSFGYNCIELSKATGFKEILGGRVKTLNPKVYGSILHLRDNKKHIEEFKNLNFPKIDLVIVNMYPFESFPKNNKEKEIIEMIDIGGNTLLRASSKNYKFITIISNTKDYKKLITNLNENNGLTKINFRKKMATKAFAATFKYDYFITKWLNKKKIIKKKINLRYGENPNQNSFILNNQKKSIFDFQISGKQIGYNNIIDVESGLKCLNEFTEPTSIIIKHNNPCGAASAKNIYLAFKKSFLSDNKSAFGGVVVLNRNINKKLGKIISNHFFEVIVAKNYDNDAFKILSNKPNLILLKINKIKESKEEFRSSIFGRIYQDTNRSTINKNFLKNVAYRKTNSKNIDDLIFSAKIAKHLKSNAIVLSNNKQTLGLGIGQTSRIDSLKIALGKYKSNFKNKSFVCVSDGFFPFTDSLKLLKKNNCRVVAQAYGSKNDGKLIEFSNRNKISLYFLKDRLFKH